MSNQIRVLHMIGSLEYGGSQAMVLNLYKAIDRDKVQFDFIMDQPHNNALLPVVQQLGARVYTLPVFKGNNYVEVKNAWESFLKEHTEYSILHSHIRSYASIYIPIAKKYGLKTIIHSHSTSNGKGIKAIAKKIMQYPLRWQADYFFGCSRKSGEWLFGKKVVDGNKFYMIKNAIDTDIYKADDKIREKYRVKLNIDNNQKVFIHIGRLHEAKNHMFLLDVFNEVVKENSNAILLLVGDGELHNKIENRIKELGLDNNVMMLGARSDVANILQAADCFLFPSSWEGLPVTVIEAQAAGLPCLISDKITDEVVITTLVKKLPIDQGVNCWNDAIHKILINKCNVTKQICEAGFDIKKSAQWLQDFYEGILIDG